jgi:hypothetical protein
VTYVNTRYAVVPQIFMPRASSEAEQHLPCFYEIPEDVLYHMASDHYAICFNMATGFSSWAASLHLVLCYAKYLNGKYKTDTAHVAVIDTHNLEDEVLVWHVPHLLGYGNHEYLAFGRTRGKGYRAVRLADLDSHDLKKISRSWNEESMVCLETDYADPCLRHRQNH